jgi:putative endonuclease
MLKGLLKKMAATTSPTAPNRVSIGQKGETEALEYLLGRGLTLVERNYRVAAGPSRRGGEVDLMLCDVDGTLVFVEVRKRSSGTHGGAADSIQSAKRRKIIYAAQHYLSTMASPPPCRFDVIAIDGQHLQWIRAAFDVSTWN